MKQAGAAATLWALGCRKCVFFVDGIIAFDSLHCNTKLESIVAASESSTSTLRHCCDVSAKWTTLTCFVACDIAMLLSVALAMCIRRRFKATLRV
jgi:hypothetical protein